MGRIPYPGRTRRRLRTRTPDGLAGAVPEARFEFSIDGRPVPAVPGQSIAAALWAAGIMTWRTTRVNGRPRGAFCSIGSCFDCLATVNGRPNQRACLVPVRPGDRVTTQEGDGHADLVR